ncbi:MAG: YceI family protein [Chitinophagales bacterium]|nr:YceI family protein [Chitinophagales bacterium]
MRFVFFLFALITSFSVQAQTNKYTTNSGHIWFFSDAPLEDITAHNKQVQVILDKSTGDMAFKVVMKNYLFDKAEMQKHFNEKNWLDTQTYPNSTFEGKITNLADVNFGKDGTYNVTVTGKLTMKGVAKTITQKGTIEVKAGKIIMKAKFTVDVTQYGVKIPADNVTKINKNIEINIDATLAPYVR